MEQKRIGWSVALIVSILFGLILTIGQMYYCYSNNIPDFYPAIVLLVMIIISISLLFLNKIYNEVRNGDW